MSACRCVYVLVCVRVGVCRCVADCVCVSIWRTLAIGCVQTGERVYVCVWLCV